MNLESTDIKRELKGLKRWVIVGAFGFLLIGLSAGISTYLFFNWVQVMESHNLSCEKKELKFPSEYVKDLVDRNEIDEALILINLRLETHPNDASAHWLKARSHQIKEEWVLAIKHLDRVEMLNPGWKSEYIEPLREKINELSK
jgi:hypothetical protein|tara:strand:+ start:1508 stop:1939 length:432 start_codon:yes stop_codon:yes gene_type:complete